MQQLRLGKPIASLHNFQGGRLSGLVHSIKNMSNFHAKGIGTRNHV